jgi:hypothetical protein
MRDSQRAAARRKSHDKHTRIHRKTENSGNRQQRATTAATQQNAAECSDRRLGNFATNFAGRTPNNLSDRRAEKKGRTRANFPAIALTTTTNRSGPPHEQRSTRGFCAAIAPTSKKSPPPPRRASQSALTRPGGVGYIIPWSPTPF